MQRQGGSLPKVIDAVDAIARQGGTPLVVADGAAGAGRHPPQGHRQRRHPGALSRPAAHGHQDGHDHRGQPGHRRLHRRRGRRGRLPGRGHARGQARPDPRVPGRRSSGGHDRRRHQRRSGAGPGRRGRGHEHRHAGGQRGRQHGGPRLESHQAAGDSAHRQADAHDQRGAHHLQHRQRHRQVLRHHPGGFRRHLSSAGRAQRDAADHSSERGALGGDLQRGGHRLSHPAGAAGSQVQASPGEPSCCATTCSSTGWAGWWCRSPASRSSISSCTRSVSYEGMYYAQDAQAKPGGPGGAGGAHGSGLSAGGHRVSQASSRTRPGAA